MSAVVPEDVRKATNLRLLQRSCDPNILDIDETATHVVLYEFREQSWFKHNYEGSCFLCHGGAYTLIILNRNSADNFQLNLTKGMQFQEQEPYLIIKTADKKINGLYFHNKDELSKMTKAFQAAQQRVEQGIPPPGPPRPTSAPTPSSAPVHAEHTAALLSMLSINGSQTTSTQPSTQTSTSPSQIDPDTVLDKKSLQLALMSLLNDERFIDLIHSQYIKVVRSRAKKNRN